MTNETETVQDEAQENTEYTQEEIEEYYTTFINHGEEHFGYLNHFWGEDEQGDLGFLICKYTTFDSTDENPLFAYITVGLSLYDFITEETGTQSRHEYIILSLTDYDGEEDPVATLLASVGKMEISNFTAYEPGNILDMVEPHTPESPMHHLYILQPMFLPGEAAILPVPDEYDFTAKLRWVIPLYEEEAEYASDGKPESMVQLLEDTQPDVSDFARESVVEP